MRTMTNPKEVFEIHKGNRQFRAAIEKQSNIAVRVFISSLGFKAPRELAEKFIEMANNEVGLAG